jgi:hypothetical protein
MLLKNVLTAFVLLLLISCQKEISKDTQPVTPPVPLNQWVEHTIAKGTHNSNKNSFRAVNTTEMRFVVKFDNSAIYQTVDTNNQRDINKLYGFSDNNQEHHTNSARIGWRWYQNELQLFAYIYNNTVQSDKFITAVPLNQEINGNIKAEGSLYTFKVNNVVVTMPRASTTAGAVGYQLYPYFGGDEPSPQEIKIQVKDL